MTSEMAAPALLRLRRVTLNQFAGLKFFTGGLRGTHLVNLLVAARNIIFLGFYSIFLQKFQVVKDAARRDLSKNSIIRLHVNIYMLFHLDYEQILAIFH